MTKIMRSCLWIVVLVIFVACTAEPTPTLSGAIVPSREPTATATATLTPTHTATATVTSTPTTTPSNTPTLTPSNTPTITPSPTRVIPTVNIGDVFTFTDNNDITDTDWRVQYTFTASAGDSISVEMNTDSARLDPLLILVDEDETRLTENDDTAENSDNAAIMNYVIETDGTYTILATRRGENDSPYVGPFQLTFLRLPSNYYDPDTGIALMPLALNVDETGVINDEVAFESYIFTASAGTIVSVTMNRASGDLDPYIVLVNRQTREILAENDDDPRDNISTTNAFIDSVTLPADGEYIVLATRYQGVDGSSAGDFVLRVSTQE